MAEKSDKFFFRWRDFTKEQPPKEGLFLVRFKAYESWYIQYRKWQSSTWRNSAGYEITHWAEIVEPGELPNGEFYYGG